MMNLSGSVPDRDPAIEARDEYFRRKKAADIRDAKERAHAMDWDYWCDHPLMRNGELPDTLNGEGAFEEAFGRFNQIGVLFVLPKRDVEERREYMESMRDAFDFDACTQRLCSELQMNN